MKRNMLLAFLVAVAATTASLVGAPPASADPECRYSIHPGPAPVPGPLLPNDLLYIGDVTSILPYRTSFEPQQPLWSVVAIRSAERTDYNLAVRDCELGLHASSTLSDAPVDFVALDGNQLTTGRMAATVSNAGEGIGTFALEYSTGGRAPEPGTWETLLMRGTPALVRDVYVPEGTSTTVVLRLVSGDADLAVVDSESTSDTWLRSRAQAVQSSANPGLSEEAVTLTVPEGSPGRTFGVVVVNNADVTEAVLYRS
jgi:hypothetical protein